MVVRLQPAHIETDTLDIYTHKEDNLSLQQHRGEPNDLIADSGPCQSQPPWKLVA